MADQWFVWMVAISWQVAAMAGMVWVLTFALRKGFARVRWILWLLVVAKLVVSPEWATPWSLGTMADRYAVSDTGDGGLLTTTEAEAPVQFADDVGTALALDLGVAFPSGESASPRVALLTSETLFLVWAVVAVSLMVFCFVQYLRFRRVVMSGWTDPGEELGRFFVAQCGLMKLGGGVRLKVSPAIQTAAVFGAFRPTVLMPEAWEERFTREELQAILVHELAHVRRGDLAWGWVVSLITCLYWFHPVVWLVNGMLRREREMACDDVVLKVTEQEGEAYASTLVRVAESFRGKFPHGAGVLGVLEVYDHLLHRVRSAADGTRSRGLGWRSVALLAVVTMLLPMGIWPAAIEAESKKGIDAEIAAHYSKAHPEVQEYIRWTSKTFGPRGLWMDADSYDKLSKKERREKVAYLKALLEDGEYGRHLCEGVTQAGVLGDPTLLDGVTKVAAFHLADRDYDCRPKWMGVAALGRLDDERAVPTLVPLVDHGNMNTRMWARA